MLSSRIQPNMMTIRCSFGTNTPNTKNEVGPTSRPPQQKSEIKASSEIENGSGNIAKRTMQAAGSTEEKPKKKAHGKGRDSGPPKRETTSRPGSHVWESDGTEQNVDSFSSFLLNPTPPLSRADLSNITISHPVPVSLSTDLPPTFDASPLLDPRRYCRRGRRTIRNQQKQQPHALAATLSAAPPLTTSGADAARRLKEGREEAVNVIQCHLVGQRIHAYVSPDHWMRAKSAVAVPSHQRHKRGGNRHRCNIKRDSPVQNPPKSFFLVGHGVPEQLLKDHIDMAHGILLKSANASEVGFYNFDGRLDVDWMRIRNSKGKHSVAPWPRRCTAKHLEDAWRDYEHRLQLYLTVMNRIASTFGLILGLSDHQNKKKNEPFPLDFPLIPLEQMENNCTHDHMDTILFGTERASLRHWNVSFLRGDSRLHYPRLNIDPDAGTLGPPLVELSKGGFGYGMGLSSSSKFAPAHVRVVMQGFPSPFVDIKDEVKEGSEDALIARTLEKRRKKRPAPVTVVFDACFFGGKEDGESK